MILAFIDNPDVAIINVINDGPGSQNCQTWGENGDERVPIIINEHTGSPYPGAPGQFNNWFSGSSDEYVIDDEVYPSNWNNPYSSPWYIFIDKDFRYIHLSGYENFIVDILNTMLED